MVTAVRGSNLAPFNPFLAPPNQGPSQALPQSISAPSNSRNQEPDRPSSFGGQQDDSTPTFGTEEEYTQEETRKLEELKLRDRAVRQHEQAHLAVAGRYARGGATLQYETGPDGKQYAVGGEVSISTSKESSPEQTLKKAQTIRRAALAPADPSPQDRNVAAQASQLENQARREIRSEKSAEAAAEKEDRPTVDQTSPEPAAGASRPPEASRTPPIDTNAGQLLDLLG